MLERIVLASPRGFCAGVSVAVDTVRRLAEKFPEESIYMVHQVVHNKHVVADLEKNYNVQFVETIEEVPKESRVVLSAHGTPPEVYALARKRNIKITDATCDLVEAVHRRARHRAKKGKEIILIGHKGHQEVIGTMGQAPMHLVQTPEDVEKLTIPPEKDVTYLTQTTLSHYDIEPIKEAIQKKYPSANVDREDICYATTNRQEAVMAIASRVEGFLIIGEPNSSNSKRLVETAKQYGVPNAHLISTYNDIQSSWLEQIRAVGVSSGASAPEYLVEQVVDHLKKTYNATLEVFYGQDESNMTFPKKKLV